MTAFLREVLARVLEREGGIADVGDGKGVTRFGQTPLWLEAHGFEPPDTPEQATENYARWAAMYRFDRLVEENPLLGDVVIDYAIHSSERPAIRALQKVLGVEQDGVIGPRTLLAVAKPLADKVWLAKRVLGERQRHVGRILRDDPSKAKFAAGWMDRLADQWEAMP